MPETTSPYGQAAALFDGYPQAITYPGWDMILIVPPAGGLSDPGVYVLSRHDKAITIRRWGSGSRHEDVAVRGLSDEFRDAIDNGVPWPLASLYGWTDNAEVTAVLTVYGWPGSEDDAMPACSLMPRADLPPTWWLPGVPLGSFGWWWWQQVQALRIVPLAPLIAPTTGIVTSNTGGEHQIVGVHADLKSPDGWMLRSGVYADYRDLDAGLAPPPLAELHIRRHGVRDLAPSLAWQVSHTPAPTPGR
jgi:hypothetical protein